MSKQLERQGLAVHAVRLYHAATLYEMQILSQCTFVTIDDRVSSKGLTLLEIETDMKGPPGWLF
jgi:hypothetical protein